MSEHLAARIRDLEKLLGDCHLGPVSLELERGYVYALMGPNGAGKSTLFRTLMGLVRPDGGEVEWFGGGGTGDTAMTDAKRRIGYVPERLDLPDESWTLGEWAGFVSDWYPHWSRSRYAELLRRYELPGNKKIHSLSKGMKAKAAFVMALSQDPDLLLLDEPSSGLDPFAWRLMMEDISDFVSGGDKTVVIATHILDEIKRMADYVIFLCEGKVLGLFEKDALIDNWKKFWIDRSPTPELRIPGAVALEPDLPVRLVSSNATETEAALSQAGIGVTHTRTLEMDELFLYLVRNKKKSRNRKEF